MAAVIERLGDSWAFWCPGCRMGHGFDQRWTMTGTPERPTFSPSLVSRVGFERICHLFVRDGQIEFLADCWHQLAGKTVAMEPTEAAERGEARP